MTKQKTREEIYKQALENIRGFCMNRDFNIYCKQILQDIEYALKKAHNLTSK